MSQRKYITGTIKGDIDIEVAVLFPDFVAHASIGRLFDTIVGAGFYGLDENFIVQAYGESVGLHVKSRGVADSKLIAKALCLGGEFSRGGVAE